MLPHGLFMLALAALLLYRMYRRYRSHIGPQRVQPRRMSLRVALMVAGAVALFTLSMVPYAQLGLAAGLAAGAGLAALSLRHTRFEVREAQRYYIPNLYIGMAVSALFILRIVYRIVTVYPQLSHLGPGQDPRALLASVGQAQSLPTLALLGVVFGYYAGYYGGVLVLSRRLSLVPVPAAPG